MRLARRPGGPDLDAVLAGLASPPCPWPADDHSDMGTVKDVTSEEGGPDEETGLRELARLVADAGTLPTFSGREGSRGASSRGTKQKKIGDRAPKETRVSEFVSIIEVVDDSDDSDDSDPDNDDAPSEFLIVQRDEAPLGIYDVLLLVALYSELVPASGAPDALLGALRASTGRPTEELVMAVLPTAVSRLHDVIVAHVEFEEAQVCSATLGAYDGPSAWDRCLRCMQLTWFVKQMRGVVDSRGFEDVMLLLHALALGSKDVSYQVRNQSLACVDAFIAVITDVDQDVDKDVDKDVAGVASALVDIVKESVSANDDRCWTAGYRCAGNLVGYLSTATSSAASTKLRDELFEHVMSLAERNQHSLVYASAWLESVGAELHGMGVGLMHHAPVLLPMLVEWAKALHDEVRLGALRCLLVYVRCCWPRNHATKAMIWEDLEEIEAARCGGEALAVVRDLKAAVSS